MTDKKSRYSTDEKVRIVLQTFNPQTSMAEICREHNLVPRTVYGWKEKFLTGGRSSLEALTYLNKPSYTPKRSHRSRG